MKRAFTNSIYALLFIMLFTNYAIGQNLSKDAPANSTDNALVLLKPVSKGENSSLYYVTQTTFVSEIGFYKTTVSTPTEGTRLGDLPTSVQCMEYINGTIYGITYNSTTQANNLVSINPATGAHTILKTNVVDGTGLAWNPKTNKVYVSTWDAKFGEIDLTTGVYTHIATWSEMFTIAIDNDGICYAQAIPEEYNAKFGTVNLTTGEFTQMTTRSGTVIAIQNMEIDRETNALYWSATTAEMDFPTLYNVNKTTGALTLIGKFPRTVISFAIENSTTRVSTNLIENLSIFPNPAVNTVTVTGTDISKVEIYNALGQIVNVETTHGNDIIINVSSFRQGIYFFKVYDLNNNTTVKRISVVK